MARMINEQKRHIMKLTISLLTLLLLTSCGDVFSTEASQSQVNNNNNQEIPCGGSCGESIDEENDPNYIDICSCGFKVVEIGPDSYDYVVNCSEVGGVVDAQSGLSFQTACSRCNEEVTVNGCDERCSLCD